MEEFRNWCQEYYGHGHFINGGHLSTILAQIPSARVPINFRTLDNPTLESFRMWEDTSDVSAWLPYTVFNNPAPTYDVENYVRSKFLILVSYLQFVYIF
jgi:hypothetical protein